METSALFLSVAPVAKAATALVAVGGGIEKAGAPAWWDMPGILAGALRNPEIDFFGFLIPWGLAMGVLGFLLAWLITGVLEHFCLTRHIWHLPLFFAALVLLCGMLLGLIFTP